MLSHGGTRYDTEVGILQDIQRLNKFQTRKHKRDVRHVQDLLLNERIPHVHFGDDGEVESVEIINGLDALVLEQPTLLEVEESKRRGTGNPLRRKVKQIKKTKWRTQHGLPTMDL